MDSESKTRPEDNSLELGVLCYEAQADGIPCHELDFDCEHCAKAARKPQKRESSQGEKEA